MSNQVFLNLMRRLLPVGAAVLLCAPLCGCLSAQRAAEMEAAAASRSPLTDMQASGFTAKNQYGETVSLEDFRGDWVVLYFYPANGTPGCACQQREFNRSHAQFQNLDARIVGVSPDTVESHAQVTDKFGLNLTLLADPDHDIMDRYGAWADTIFGGRVIRSTVLIDPDGWIAYHWPEVIPEGHAERVRQKLEAIKAERRKTRDSAA